MKAIAAFALLFIVACGEPQTESGESQVPELMDSSSEGAASQNVAVYRMVSLDGQTLPGGGISSGFMEFRPDSTWELSVSYMDLAAPVTSSGGYSLRGNKEGCDEVLTWPEGLPDRKDILNVCGGVYTLEGAGWIATFEKER